MKNCPICGHEVGSYHELTHKEPYIHTNPFDGIHVYGAYSAPKETLCFENNFLHFAFYDAEGNLVQHRLVQLDVANPSTKSATDEFWEGYNSHDPEDFFDNEDWEEVNDNRELYNDYEDELPF
jgi:hypothetical protein